MTANDNPISHDLQITIRKKASQLCRRCGYSPADREDIERDLILFVLQKLRACEEQLANPDAYITTLVERHVATLLRRQKAAKRLDRHRPQPVSLHEPTHDEDGSPVEMGRLIPEQQNLARRAVEWASITERRELTEQIEELLRQLPAGYRDLCQRLMHESVPEVARELGVRPSAIFNRLARIRKYLHGAGLGEFFTKSRDGLAKKSVGKK